MAMMSPKLYELYSLFVFLLSEISSFPFVSFHLVRKDHLKGFCPDKVPVTGTQLNVLPRHLNKDAALAGSSGSCESNFLIFVAIAPLIWSLSRVDQCSTAKPCSRFTFVDNGFLDLNVQTLRLRCINDRKSTVGTVHNGTRYISSVCVCVLQVLCGGLLGLGERLLNFLHDVCTAPVAMGRSQSSRL